MAVGDSFATPDDLRNFLQITSDDMSDDVAQVFLDGATAVIESFLGWNPWAATGDLTVYAVIGGAYLDLPVKNLHDLTAASVLAPWPCTTPLSVALDRLSVDPVGIVSCRDPFVWSAGARVDVTLSCSWGYDPLPKQLVNACCTVAARGTVNPEGIQSRTVGTVSERYAMAGRGMTATGYILGDAEQAMLSGYEVF